MKKVTCSSCRFYMKELNRCGWHGADCRDAEGERWCDKLKPPTVFDRITRSPEALAVEFVEMMYDRVYGEDRYYSTLTGEFYNNYEEAVASTIEELKEVQDE